MKANIISPITLDDGIYKGVWSAYNVKITYNGSEYNLKTDLGIRSIYPQPCAVAIFGSKDKKGTAYIFKN